MTLRIDRAQLDAAAAHYLDEANLRSANRRERNADDGSCINERVKVKTHGLATHGRRCFRCHLVHKHGAVVAHSMPEYKAAQPVFTREASS